MTEKNSSPLTQRLARRRIIQLACATLALLHLASIECDANYPKRNRYMTVSGGGYISIPNSPSLNADLAAGGSFTIDAWIFPTSYANIPTIVGNNWTSGYWVGISSAGKIRFYPGGGQYSESNASVPLNAWTHVAVSFNQGKKEVRFFINNALDKTATLNVTIGTNASDLRIGADRSGAAADYLFYGSIDEVRIWRTEIYFPSATGALFKVPQQWASGEYGNFLASAWRLNGSADDSVSTNNGTPVGALAWQQALQPPIYSRICAALVNNSPNTHDYFIIPHSSANSLTQSFTLECWVNLTAGGGGATTYQTFITKGAFGSGQLSYWLGWNVANGKLRFVPNGVWATALESSDPLPTNKWVHVAAMFQWNGSIGSARMFIDGVVKGTKTFQSFASANQHPVLIGTADMQLQPPASYPLNGRIDEVRIWNTVLSDAAIGNNYRQEIDGAIPGLAASYHFDGDLVDLSPNANHGFNTNGASLSAYFADASDLPPFPVLTLTVPNGGESWQIGSLKNILWSSGGLSQIRVELSRDGGVNYTDILTDSISAPTGNLGWTVVGNPTNNARVRVSTTTLPELSDESNADFSIVEPPPVLSVVPNALVFNGVRNAPSPAPKTLVLKNTGGGTMNWTAVASPSWLSVSSPSGSGNADSVVIEILTTSLPVGNHFGTITFNGNASNVPIVVNVMLTLAPPPHIATSPASLLFTTTVGNAPLRRYLKITNTSSGTLGWSASTSTPWITLVGATGGQNDSVGVDIVPGSLAVGTYLGSISIDGNADNSPQEVQVTLVITQSPLYPVAGAVREGSNGIGGIAIKVSGDSVVTITTAPDGSYSIAGLRPGAYLLTPHSPYFDFSPASRSIIIVGAAVSGIDFSAQAKSGSAKVHYKAGWNLISLPVVPANGDLATLFADAERPVRAFRYLPDSGYRQTTTLQFGVGYWIKFTRDDSVSIVGSMRRDFMLALSGMNGGWNCIGGTSGDVAFAAITQTPAGSVVTVYQYDPVRGYELIPGDVMKSGRGFFIKTSRDATISLHASALPRIDIRNRRSTLPDVLSLPAPPSADIIK